MQYAPNRNPAPLFSPFFSGKTEKIGPPEARQKRPRRNEPPQATSLFLCARFFLSKPQAKLAVWVFVQICGNLSVSAAPSQHPYPFCPFGTFPPDRGNRPLEGEPFPARRHHPSKFPPHLLLPAVVLRQLFANLILTYQAARSKIYVR